MSEYLKIPDDKSDYYGFKEGYRTFDDDYSDTPIYWACNYCSESIHQDELFDHLDNCDQICTCEDCLHENLDIEHCDDDNCGCCDHTEKDYKQELMEGTLSLVNRLNIVEDNDDKKWKLIQTTSKGETFEF